MTDEGHLSYRTQLAVVDEFMTKMGVYGNEGAYALQVTCLKEEVKELEEARDDFLKEPTEGFLGEYLKETGDCMFIALSLVLLKNAGFYTDPQLERLAMQLVSKAGSLARVIDELAYQAEYTGFLEEVIREITRSNLSKLGNDGVPIRRADGKVLKGPNYSPADMKPIVKKLLGK